MTAVDEENGKRIMRVLTLTTLYPNAEQPRHGIFVEQRLRQLVGSGAINARVVAPVPWFPIRGGVFGRYGRFARVRGRETRHGIDVLHPRYPLVPKVGMNLTPWLMAASLHSVLRRMVEEGSDFDLIDAHYFFPDGVAAALVGKWLGKPVVITARGSDVNVLARYRLPRRMIRWACNRSAAIITVSKALKDGLVKMGVAQERVTVLPNGVDLDQFYPCGRRLSGFDDRPSELSLLSVGHLIPGKGHHHAVEALRLLAHANLLIIGDGPCEGELRRLAKRLGVDDRVRIIGNVTQEVLRGHYCEADALILASEREGMPNVVLEAIACGTPVLATAVGGIPEILSNSDAGLLLREASAEAIAEASEALIHERPTATAVRKYAEHFDWSSTVTGQLELFATILSRQRIPRNEANETGRDPHKQLSG